MIRQANDELDQDIEELTSHMKLIDVNILANNDDCNINIAQPTPHLPQQFTYNESTPITNVGDNINVFWPLMDEYYPGVITS